MAGKTFLVCTSALLLSSLGTCIVVPAFVTVPDVPIDTNSVAISTSSATSATSTSSLASSTTPSSSSVSASASATADVVSCEGKDSGSTFTHATSKAVYDVTCGADYPNGDVEFLWTDSFDACVAACDEESSCLTVAFRSGACYLKDQVTTSVADAGIWSAKKHDAGTVPSSTGPSCVDKASDASTYRSSSGKNFKIVCGREYYGGDLTSASTASFKECIDTCSANSECVDVSYVNGACYLKRSTSTLMEAGHVWTAELIDLASTASAASTTPSMTPTTSAAAEKKELTCIDNKDNKQSYTATNGGTYVVECGVDYYGNDLPAVDSVSFAACMDTCDSTDGCVDVSYVWGRCYLKSAVTSSSPAGHVWTGRKTSAGPSDSEALSALNQDGGSFCTSYIHYKAPVTRKVTTTTPGASTVLSIQTVRSTSTKLSTVYVTAVAVQTLPALQPRQAIPTPSIISGLPASRISSMCSLVATGTSTIVSTATATVPRTTLVSTFTSVIPVTQYTAVSTFVTTTTRAPQPTAAVNLDFETGDLYNWWNYNSQPGFSAAVVSPGHSRSGVTSNWAVQMSKSAGTTTGYSFSQLQQNAANLVSGQTYRIEFSWKYSADVSSSDVCSTWVSFWGVRIANLIPSTTSSRMNSEHYLYSTTKCGTGFSFNKQASQSAGEWRRYTSYYKAPSNVEGSQKQIWFGLQCNAGTQAVDQSVVFDDFVIAPEAAC
ncbi:hypothetical protein EKO04_004265 [Ascochyta lentis]|uniref:Apple domain-containing protein n=1 Tax=Ascochyta lentis TaxID=205686 RepID=A0A8H7J7M5_9PLEO|nr:hypothetical protein EKO04_004265 [Ascochyta lentis]